MEDGGKSNGDNPLTTGKEDNDGRTLFFTSVLGCSSYGINERELLHELKKVGGSH